MTENKDARSLLIGRKRLEKYYVVARDARRDPAKATLDNGYRIPSMARLKYEDLHWKRSAKAAGVADSPAGRGNACCC